MGVFRTSPADVLNFEANVELIDWIEFYAVSAIFGGPNESTLHRIPVKRSFACQGGCCPWHGHHLTSHPTGFEANVTLNLRKLNVTLQYIVNLKAAIDNPAYDFPDEAGIFTSEARAIELTFEQIDV